MRLHLAIAAGTALGGTGRHLVDALVTGPLGLPPQAATLAVNLLGSLLIGLFAGLAGPGGRLRVGPEAYQAVVTGLLGGLTTFSLLGLQTLQGSRADHLPWALTGLLLHLLAAVAAAGLGHVLATRLNRRHHARTDDSAPD
ncbi:MAG: CrcB family protein [Ectothiorhodospira sp.]